MTTLSTKRECVSAALSAAPTVASTELRIALAALERVDSAASTANSAASQVLHVFHVAAADPRLNAMDAPA